MAGERTIFISGGASGIGLAVARLFAARNWRVALADIDANRLATAAAELSARTYTMDVRDHAAWVSALEDFTAATGRLDVLFNNAGIPHSGPLAQCDMAGIERTVAVNLLGVLNGAHAAHRFLKATSGSCMLVTSSAAGIRGTPGAATYSATKFAVRGLAEALDGEWAPDGIRVRTLMPSFIETPLLDQAVNTGNHSVRQAVQAAGLEITPVDQVAEAAWRAVHGTRLHTQVGKTAHRLWFLSRWAPGVLRKSLRKR